jgi:asparagine synthase (glutamine-hydrolysing)
MSAVLGVFPGTGPPPDETMLRAMVSRMSARGTAHVDAWRDGAAALGVARYDWELDASFSGGARVVRDGDLVVAADASLYYRADLGRALAARGVRPTGETASHLALAAYRAWGRECAERLEGDFAFVLWDGARREVFCARDFAGGRPLYYAEVGGTLIVASTIGAILAHPGCSQALNLASIADAAVGLYSATHDTAYEGVYSVPAGCALVRNPGRAARVLRYWEPPPVQDRRETMPFAEAAMELRELLGRAVAERTAGQAKAAVWLSGGWDSTAVFAAGRQRLASQGAATELMPVSVSYPQDDPGYEDDLIQAVADRWDRPVSWIRIADIPFLLDPAARAADRDEPHAHLFETFNLALGRRTRELGARVALSGKGGDEIFDVSDVCLADLLRRGHWFRLAREWSARRNRSRQRFVRYVLQPVLPQALGRAAAALAGLPSGQNHLERQLAGWLDPTFVRDHSLDERQRFTPPARPGEGFAARELTWALLHPAFPRFFAQVCALGLDEGVEVRAPLYDLRVIGLACRRPWWERNSRGETKRLLRQAGVGLLPDHVLAPRRTRTGVTSGYMDREIRTRWASYFRQMFREMTLGDVGIVSPPAVREAWDRYLLRGDANLGANLWCTLQTELWLRGKLNGDIKLTPPGQTTSDMSVMR